MPERNHIDFSLVVTNDGLLDNAKSRLAYLTELQPSQIQEQEVERLADAIPTGLAQFFTKPLFEKYIEKNPEERLLPQPTSKRIIEERVQTLLQQSEILRGDETHYMSYGVAAPSYLQALTEHKEVKRNTWMKTLLRFFKHASMAETTPSSEHRSLLVGALTPATVSEYAVVTDHVFPNAELHVVDIEGETTKIACEANAVQWHNGDCLAMPFPADTFDTVQSNYLLDKIESPRGEKDIHKTIGRYFQQVFDILKSRGRIIGVETPIPQSMVKYLDNTIAMGQSEMYMVEARKLREEFKQELHELLQRSGFTEIQVREAPSFHSRADLDRQVMLGNTWDFSQVPLDQESLLITAVKP